MDEIEVRVHDEINDYREKFGPLTFRQMVCSVIMFAINIPLYLFSTPVIGEELASYLIIFMAIPFVFLGFIKIQDMDAEKIIPFWWRNYVKFYNPLENKTDKEVEEEKNNKNRKKSKSKRKKEKVHRDHKTADSCNAKKATEIRAEKMLSKREKRKNRKIEKQNKKQQKRLDKARKKYGVFEKNQSAFLEKEDIEKLKQLISSNDKETNYAKKEKES